MKLFCISDLHGNLTNLDLSNCDLVIIAGDFAKMTGWSKWHMYDMKKWIEKKFIPFIQQYKNTQFVITPGNHDLIFDSRRTLNISDISYSINWPENVHILIDRQIEVNGLKIYGRREFKKLRKELNVALPIMLDTRGPELRVRTFELGSVQIKKGQKL